MKWRGILWRMVERYDDVGGKVENGGVEKDPMEWKKKWEKDPRRGIQCSIQWREMESSNTFIQVKMDNICVSRFFIMANVLCLLHMV